MLRFVILTAFSLCCCRVPETLDHKVSPGPARLVGYEFDVVVDKGIEYCRRPGRPALRLDLYRPECPGPHPAALVVPGNAWKFGSRHHQDVLSLCRCLAREGIAALGISYRRPSVDPHPAQIEDCLAAMQFARANAAAYDLDPNRIAAVGASAGGHLAALLATRDDVADRSAPDAVARASSKPNCVVALSAPLDLSMSHNEPPTGLQVLLLSEFLGLGLEDAQTVGPNHFLALLESRAASASPLEFVDAGDPPFLLVHGEIDRVVPVGHSRRMHRALTDAGVPCRLVIEPDSGHAHYFLSVPPNEWASERGPRFWKETRRFLAEQLLGRAGDGD